MADEFTPLEQHLLDVISSVEMPTYAQMGASIADFAENQLRISVPAWQKAWLERVPTAEEIKAFMFDVGRRRGPAGMVVARADHPHLDWMRDLLPEARFELQVVPESWEHPEPPKVYLLDLDRVAGLQAAVWEDIERRWLPRGETMRGSSPTFVAFDEVVDVDTDDELKAWVAQLRAEGKWPT